MRATAAALLTALVGLLATVPPAIAATRGSAAPPWPEGESPLGLEQRRDGLVYVPPGLTPGERVPLVVLLHGAGGHARGVLPVLLGAAERGRFILLVPESRGATWDVVLGAAGPDLAVLQRALQKAMDGYSVDPARVAVAGFSDGASYALSVGITNGDTFTHVAAFSPGFMQSGERSGRPRVYISHGDGDRILPIAPCGRRLQAELKREGYDVTYHEFHGGHAVPEDVVREAVAWFLRGAEPPRAVR